MIGIAFLTLIERKILGYIQLRKGPNKLFIIGLLQPIADGVKLFLKEDRSNLNLNFYLYNIFPSLSFFFIFVFWILYNFNFFRNIYHRMILFLLVSGLGVYGIIGMGWASNSKYSLLGAYRRVAQTISYEVTIVFTLIIIIVIYKNYNLKNYILINEKVVWIFFGFIFIFLIWSVVIIAELNRAPFDFAEGESELVSGFNVEYGRGKFALIFLAEYGNIIFIRYLTIELFFINFYIIYTLLFMIIVILYRGTYVRYRYDNLIYLNWKVYLPFVLIFFMFFIIIIIYLYIIN